MYSVGETVKQTIKMDPHCLFIMSGISVNPFMKYELAHLNDYHLGESTFFFRGIRSDFELKSHFNDFFSNSPRWDAMFCRVASGANLFAYVS